jgi:hypothetical protein
MILMGSCVKSMYTQASRELLGSSSAADVTRHMSVSTLEMVTGVDAHGNRAMFLVKLKFDCYILASFRLYARS